MKLIKFVMAVLGLIFGVMLFFWLFVGIPLTWGVWTTVTKALVLFTR